MAEKKKKSNIKKPSEKEQKEMQEKYTTLFKDVVKTIQKEENVGIVYQVLADILMQLEQNLRAQMNGSDCSHSCNHNCGDCEHE